jgi:hypothetical protein
MTTRPGYVWDNTNSEWVEIGQAAVIAPVSYQATEPTSPATGDIWIDSDDEVPGITSSLNYRWRKIATGGETSLSGNDTSGLPLAYNPGYEQVYLNGVLLYRGSDYVATTGNTITGLTALVAGDTIEVLSFVTAPIGDTYTQAAVDAKFNAGGLVHLNTTTVTASTSNYVNGVFSSTYDNYKIILNGRCASGQIGFYYQNSVGGVAAAGSNYAYSSFYVASSGASGVNFTSTGNSLAIVGQWLASSDDMWTLEVANPAIASKITTGSFSGSYGATSTTGGFSHAVAASYDGFRISTPSNWTGTISTYGYRK